MPSDIQRIADELATNADAYAGLDHQQIADAFNDEAGVTVEVNTIASAALWSAIDWKQTSDADARALNILFQSPTINVRGTGLVARLQETFGGALDWLLFTTISRREALGITDFKKIGDHHIREALGIPEAPIVLNVDLPLDIVSDLEMLADPDAVRLLNDVWEDVVVNGETMVKLPLPVVRALMDSTPAPKQAEMQKYLTLEWTLGHDAVGITEEARKALVDEARAEAGVNDIG